MNHQKLILVSFCLSKLILICFIDIKFYSLRMGCCVTNNNDLITQIRLGEGGGREISKER